MRQAGIALVISCLVMLTAVAQPSVPTLLGEARRDIASRHYREALQKLDEALVATEAIASRAEQQQAEAAIRFYAAQAAFSLKDEERARRELLEFFTLMPEADKLDPSKYDRKYVRFFASVKDSLAPRPAGRFDQLYPGWGDGRAWKSEEPPAVRFAESPEFVLLASPEEREQWSMLRTDRERMTFVESFWSDFDPTPEEEPNEFRRSFRQRALFADETFGRDAERGALTDRGRVFILLGPPMVVNLRPLTGSEGGNTRARSERQTSPRPPPTNPSTQDSMNAFRSMEAEQKSTPLGASTPVSDGLVEVWIYSREMLAESVPADKVEFKFISEKGYGDHVLQREPLVIRALEDAAAKRSR